MRVRLTFAPLYAGSDRLALLAADEHVVHEESGSTRGDDAVAEAAEGSIPDDDVLVAGSAHGHVLPIGAIPLDLVAVEVESDPVPVDREAGLTDLAVDVLLELGVLRDDAAAADRG